MTSAHLVVTHLTRQRLASIFARVTVIETGCWIWCGVRDKHGYGHVYHEGRVELTHRFMYAWLIGSLPRGRRRGIPVLDHIACDNKSCCNPAHVTLVTDNWDNIKRSTKIPSAI